MNSLSRARIIALVAPLLMLGGAYAFQFVGGLPPCEMCWWQRYPHFAAVPLALIAFALRGRVCQSALFTGLAGLMIGISGLIGLFHAGVEYGWWEGLTACSTSLGGAGADILDQIMAGPITRCDVAPWSLMGISIAGYNGILSGGLALAILALLMKWRKA